MSERLLRVLIPLLVAVAHIGAFFQFKLQTVTTSLPSHWGIQFTGLLAFSLLLSILPLFWRKPVLIWTMLGLKALILILIGLPMGSYLGAELTLLSSVLIEAIIYTKLWEGLFFTIVLTLAIIFFQHRIKAWDIILPAASLHDVISTVIYVVLVVTLSILLRFQNNVSYRELNRRLNEATINLAETNIQLQEYAALVEKQAVINEGKRLGREIHDTLGYLLTNLLMMLEAALGLSEEKSLDLHEHLESTRDQAKQGLVEVRRTLHSLRPTLYESRGLVAIQNLLSSFTKATHVEVELSLGDAPLHFGEEVDLTVYRLVQEGITNAIRHGKATWISVSFYRKEGGVDVFIRDNGVGTSCIEDGYGLIGMRERIERLGGYLSIVSKPGEGFKLSAWIPLNE